jgi:hypothetical protein
MTMTDQPPKTASIDKDALRKKYAEERDKRLRADGNEQYLEIKGKFAHYLDDPYTPVTPRAPKIGSRSEAQCRLSRRSFGLLQIYRCVAQQRPVRRAGIPLTPPKQEHRE